MCGYTPWEMSLIEKYLCARNDTRLLPRGNLLCLCVRAEEKRRAGMD